MDQCVFSGRTAVCSCRRKMWKQTQRISVMFSTTDRKWGHVFPLKRRLTAGSAVRPPQQLHRLLMECVCKHCAHANRAQLSAAEQRFHSAAGYLLDKHLSVNPRLQWGRALRLSARRSHLRELILTLRIQVQVSLWVLNNSECDRVFRVVWLSWL